MPILRLAGERAPITAKQTSFQLLLRYSPDGLSLNSRRKAPHVRRVILQFVRSFGHALVIGGDLEHFVAQFDGGENFCKHAALFRTLSVVLAVAIQFSHGRTSLYAELGGLISHVN
jgi:hypothetical protein